MSPSLDLLWTLFLVAITAGLGAYLGTYLREKAKNLATREDIERIVAKTEEVKAQVSGDLWVRQKRWDLKREIYGQLLETLEEVRSSTLSLARLIARFPANATDEAERDWETRYEETNERRNKAYRTLHRLTALGTIFLPQDAVDVLDRLSDGWPKRRPKDEHFYYEEQLDSETAAAAHAYQLLVACAKQDLLGIGPK